MRITVTYNGAIVGKIEDDEDDIGQKARDMAEDVSQRVEGVLSRIEHASTYQALAMRTRPGFRPTTLTARQLQVLNAALGMSGEAGEVLEHCKKNLFQGHAFDREHVIKEIGDVCWYIVEMCDALDVELSDVFARNIAKLKARYPEGFKPVDSIEREPEMEVCPSCLGLGWSHGTCTTCQNIGKVART